MIGSGGETPFLTTTPRPQMGSVGAFSSSKTDVYAESLTGRAADSVDIADPARGKLENDLQYQGRGASQSVFVSYADLQASLEEEDRFPPGLLRMLRDLYAKTEKSAQPKLDIAA